METSAAGVNLIKAFENCLKPVGRGKFKPYICPAGVLTIGWGHTNHHGRRFGKNDIWTQAECDEALAEDLAGFEQVVSRRVKVKLSQPQFDALVSFAYNCGEGNLSKSTLLKKVNAGDFEGASREFAKWNKGGGKVLAGLVRRRASEALLFQGLADENYDGKADGPKKPIKEPMPQRVDAPEPGADSEPSPEPDEAAPPHNQQSVEIETVQRRLAALGYAVGGIDGKWGGMTAGGIAAFKNDRKLAGEAAIDDALKAELDLAEAEGFTRPIAKPRAEADEKKAAETAPEIVPVARGRLAALWATAVSFVVSAASAVGDYFQDALDWLVNIKQYFADVPGWLWLVIAGVVAAFFYLNARTGAKEIVEAVRKGERL